MSTSIDRDSEVARGAASLQRLEKLGQLLDTVLPIPGTRFRIGLDGILGFIPGIGDAAGAAISAYLIFEAARLGVPIATLLRMAGNVAIDTVIGAVPVVGDLFDIAWKANLKNLALVRGQVVPAGVPGRSPSQVGRLFMVPVMLALLVLLVLSIAVVALVFRFVFG
ncbi:MAG: DUF4112 domain-containing protein [Pseudomonadota bacterium]|nr:DUF4112 domain-containing protein [Pseudomonadota bacterium]